MEKKYSLMLDSEFIQYCELNGIINIEETAKKIFQQGFTIYKYGMQPPIKVKPEPTKEVIVTKKETITKKDPLYNE